MKLFVLMDNIAHEGGSPKGVYTTQQKAEEQIGRDVPPSFWSIVPIEIDQPERYWDALLRSELGEHINRQD